MISLTSAKLRSFPFTPTRPFSKRILSGGWLNFSERVDRILFFKVTAANFTALPEIYVCLDPVVGPPSGVRAVSDRYTLTWSTGKASSWAVTICKTVTKPRPISADEMRVSTIPSGRISISADALSGAPSPNPVFLKVTVKPQERRFCGSPSTS